MVVLMSYWVEDWGNYKDKRGNRDEAHGIGSMWCDEMGIIIKGKSGIKKGGRSLKEEKEKKRRKKDEKREKKHNWAKKENTGKKKKKI